LRRREVGDLARHAAASARQPKASALSPALLRKVFLMVFL
jgi:hypothetical protein